MATYPPVCPTCGGDARKCNHTHGDPALRHLRFGEKCSGGQEAHHAHIEMNGECPWGHS